MKTKYNAIMQAANEANEFGYIIDSNIKRIRLYISFIRKYDEEINSILESLHELVNANEDTDFVKQIHLIETFKGAGFLSTVSLMGEIGGFSAFSIARRVFAILRDKKPFEIITPQEHIQQYNAAKCDIAA